MTRLILLGIALGLSAPARADLSDSGSLTIGGQGIIQGTMTVQGAAFSVGGTTFSVAGGSVTLGGRLNAAAAGIKWADGSISTTASSGGGAVGGCVEISSADVYGVSSVTFSNLSSSWTYRLEWSVKMASAAPWLAIVVNSDLGANYNDSVGIDWNSGRYSYTYGSNGHGIYYVNTNNCTVGDEGVGTTVIKSMWGKTKVGLYTSASWNYASNGYGLSLQSGSVYRASGSLSSISVVGSTGQYTTAPNKLAYFHGHFELYRCGYQGN